MSPLQTASAVDVMVDVDSVSAARRRRERRLRQFLRHERLSVAMALSEKKHHTSRGQRKDRAGRWVRDVLHDQVPGAPTPAGALPAVRGRARRFPATLSGLAAEGHRRRSSSAPSSSSPTSYLWCRFWTLLGCWEGGIRWWRCCGSSTCRLSSRSSQCP